ncbi:MAG TPA: hypothetical protein VFO82_01940 [Steroidobacteraceae bacterium]|nr:hypothetical protein [Steroidobacteraceae bacterium]
MSARADISGSGVLRIGVALAMLAVAAFIDIECANATSVVVCDPVTLARADKAQVEELAKKLVAPQLLDEAKTFYCKRIALTIALFQTIPVPAADGALETYFTTCRRDHDWKCELSRERAIDVVEAARSETVRITTRDDLSADGLRELYAAALELAGNDSSKEPQTCHTPADLAQSLRASFVQSHSRAVKVSRDGTLSKVQRDHIELEFSIEENAQGMKTMQYRCIVRWPSGDGGR